jgi:hypothetical protein
MNMRLKHRTSSRFFSSNCLQHIQSITARHHVITQINTVCIGFFTTMQSAIAATKLLFSFEHTEGRFQFEKGRNSASRSSNRYASSLPAILSMLNTLRPRFTTPTSIPSQNTTSSAPWPLTNTTALDNRSSMVRLSGKAEASSQTRATETIQLHA